MVRLQRKRLLTCLLFIFVLFCLFVASLPYFRGEASSPPIAEGTLELHFIDVGQGDAALILCDGHAMLIDGGTGKSSRRIYTYLTRRGIDHLDYIVATHAHDDHVGGLAGALNAARANRALSSVAEAEGRAFQSFLKHLDQQGVSVTIPQPGDVFLLGGASFEVLGPLRESSSGNNMSLVLRITFGSFHALFTGDMGAAEESDILAAGSMLQSDVLKVGHHGGADATSGGYLAAVQPKIAVISCGENNDYGHPAQGTLERLEACGAEILRTDQLGDIVLTVQPDGACTRTDNATDDDSADSAAYIVNTGSGKFHLPNCPSAAEISDGNRLEFTGSRETLIDRGYTPCGRCRP